ncbi:urea transporter [Azohydromonas caseinilytica]|uniref:Urea transporter n=1 Tax=Azohydromonas caseinilytica TaxID=2728836 RepID=A0A848FFJ0_9BURK|nr:urea transporter [Azohydromonas caseinilytica]NML18997.1 urea transporter [Azohydromonas caseinilytica]
MLKPLVLAPQIVLRGLAQILLLRTATAGALVLCGLLLASPALAGAAVLGSALGSLLALFPGQPRQDLGLGLHGYNTALAAMAAQAVFEPSLAALVLIVGMVALTAFILRAWRPWPVPLYTAPFVLGVWAVTAAAPLLGLEPAAASASVPAVTLTDGLMHGLAQVLLVQSLPAGLCVLCAVALESPRLAVRALAASALGLAIGLLLDRPQGALAAGLAGFNAVLCVLALPRGTVRQVLVAASAATLLSLAAQGLGIPAFSAPFILSTWAVLMHARRTGMARN